MSCMWCARFSRHYESVEGLRGKELLYAPGQCTLNPVWTEVSGAHVCSSFVWARSYGDLTAAASWWLGNHERNQDQKDMRKEVKRLKEANRLLRDKLKQKV